MFIQLTDWYPVILSVKVALISVLVVLITGLPLSRLLSRLEFPGKDVVEAAITLPMVLPPSVIGYGLLMIIGKNGLLGHTLANLGLSIIFTWWAAVLASTVVSFPLMYQSTKAAFLSVNVNYEKAARTLGASEVKIFLPSLSLWPGPAYWPGWYFPLPGRWVSLGPL